MRSFRYYWPVIIWAWLIRLLTGLPGNYFPKVPSIWDLLTPDKIVHFFIFLVFTLMLFYGLIRSHGENFPISLFVSLSIGTGIAFGGITELLQEFVFVWRQASIYDFIADCIGSITCFFLFKWLPFIDLIKSKFQQ